MKRLLAPLALVVLVACNAGDGGADGQATTAASGAGAITEAAEKTAATGSVALEMTVEFPGSSQVPEGTTIGMTGSSTLGDPRIAELHADFEALGVGAIDMLIDDQAVYMRGGVIDQVLRSAKGGADWPFVDLASSDPAAQQFAGLLSGQNDASLLLYFLFGASDDVEEVGSETIEGAGTTRYSLTADLDEALAESPADVRDALQANIDQLEAQSVDTRLEAEVWIDEEELIRRVTYVYTMAGGAGQMLTTVDFSEFGEPIELDIPDPGDVVDVTEVQGNGS
jgi:hypothetical protein